MKKNKLLNSVVTFFLLLSFFVQSTASYAIEVNTLPTNPQIVAGSATISQTDVNLTFTQNTAQIITNWDTFNIGESASVNFIQPNTSSIALNRVLTADPSFINGRLNSNGSVFLINPSGVIFGPNSHVDVGGLVASTLNLSDSNFMNGKYHFENGGGAGRIINQGQIKGSVVALIAPRVTNEGSISALGGKVALAAGNQVTLDFIGDGLLNVNVDAAALNALVENKSLIQANGGIVFMTAKAAGDLMATVVNNTGVIQAKGISNRNGTIILDGGGQGVTRSSGRLDVSNTKGHGGKIIVTGDKVLVDEGARLDATGKTGGGEILVGGSWQGKDLNVRQATATTVAPTAILDASATDYGDGGTVVVWSDISKINSATRAFGTFLAKGGLNGGNGGRIETSGHWLDTTGARGGADALLGQAGEWLFDPYNITITSSTGNGSFASGVWTPTGDSSTILNTDINTLLEGGTSVTVSTGSAGAQTGDLTVSSAITKASGNTNVALTLRAENSIVVNAGISNTGGTGTLNVTLDADYDNSGNGDGAGIILLNSDIATNGGALNFGTGRTATVNGVSTLVGGDVYVAGAGARSLTTVGGAVNVQGEMIVANTSGLTINSTNSGSDGSVRFYGLLNSGNSYSYISGFNGTWTAALADATSGAGSGIGDTYLATITSRLENAVAGSTASYAASWLGARRVVGLGTNAVWRWVAGPEGLENSGNGRQFFTQNGSDATNGSGGSAINSGYSNWNSGEPNNFGGANLSAETESALQFVGNLGQWNDLPKASSTLPYVKETNLAASPITINAGAGTVTFSDVVGGSKALASLSVTASTIAINGGAVTTEGLQTYTGNITLGASSNVLTQTTANTDFTLQANKSITNAFGSDASLTIKTTRDIILSSSSAITSSTGKLHTTLNSDTDVSSGGAIVLNPDSSITSNGGNIVLSGGADVTTGYAQGRDNTSDSTNGISILGSSLLSNGGNITLRGKSATAGDTFSGTNSGAFGINVSKGSSGSTTNMINSGSGKISMTGVSTRTTGGAGNGIQLGLSGGGVTTTVKSSNSASDAIVISGTASSTSLASSLNYGFANYQTIQTTNGGGIQITGVGGPTSGGIFSVGIISLGNILSNSGTITLTGTGGGSDKFDIALDTDSVIGYKAATDVTSSSSNITLNADSLYTSTTTKLQSSGTLTIQPRTAGTTIGIAGGTGAISLSADNFATNFTNGFSNIVIGSTTAGAITVGGATTFNDKISLISNGNINLDGNINASGQTVSLMASSGSTVSGNGNITALNLLLSGFGGGPSYVLNTASANSVGTLASTEFISSLNFKNSGSLIVGSVDGTNGVSANGNITIEANGASADLSLSKYVQTTSGLVTLAAGRNLTNTQGIFHGGGRYLVYSTNPASTTETEISYNKHYNQTYTAGSVPAYATSGNWFLYSVAPTLLVNPNTQTINFGDSAPSFTPSYTGFIDSDNATTAGISGTASFSIAGPFTGSNFASGAHDVSYSSGLTSSVGYSIADNTSSSNELTVQGGATPPVDVSSVIGDSQGVTGTTETNTSNGNNPNLIGPGSGSTTFTQTQNRSLITNNLSKGDMNLNTSTLSTPIKLTANNQITTLTFVGQPKVKEVSSTKSVFIFSNNQIKPVGGFDVTDTGSKISLSPNASVIGNQPEIDNATLTAEDFTIKLPSGEVVKLSVSIGKNDLLKIKVIEGNPQIDTQSIVLTGLAVAKQQLKIKTNAIKTIAIVQ